jgi:hypothetical protein
MKCCLDMKIWDSLGACALLAGFVMVFERCDGIFSLLLHLFCGYYKWYTPGGSWSNLMEHQNKAIAH